MQEAKQWYDTISVKLGQAFLEDWILISESIHQNPFKSQVKIRPYRHAYFQRFPYVIVYEISPDEITVYRIVHTSRHPRQRKKKK